MFQGIYTALITPFKNGKIDEKAFQEFVEWQIKEGVHGLVPCGTTGESPTLSHAEHNRVIDLCVEVAKGRVPVMAGTGSNSTDEAIMMTKHAKKAGADGALIVAPYYNKPTQEGIYQHYKAIAEAAKLPVIIYNIPGRSVINITDDTLARLAAVPYIAGVKDATGDLARPYTLRAKLGSPLGGEQARASAKRDGRAVGGKLRRPVPPTLRASSLRDSRSAAPPQGGSQKGFALLSGEDMTAVAFNASGGQGCISVSANIAPRACAAVQEACLKGDYAKALALHSKLVELHSVLFCETNPAPVKYAAMLLGKCRPDLRLPLVMPQEENQKYIAQVLKKLRLL